LERENLRFGKGEEQGEFGFRENMVRDSLRVPLFDALTSQRSGSSTTVQV
jgi:hypothetical protein